MEEKLQILVVDNDRTLLSAIQEYLQLSHYDVTTASTGLDALRHLRSGAFDLLITDIVMPDISGLGLIEICQKDFPGLPVIAMTGYARQVKHLTVERQPDCYLEKPFKLSDLVQTIRSIFDKKKGNTPPGE